MNYFLIIALFITSFKGFSQTSENELKFFKDFLSRKSADVIAKETTGWEEIKKRLRVGKYTDWNTSDTLVLTASEVDFIAQEIEKYKATDQEKEVVKAHVTLPEAEIKNWIKKNDVSFPEEKNSDADTLSVSERVSGKAKSNIGYAFSKPIFFRNDTLCLFLFRNYFMSQGKVYDYYQVSFYKKNKNKWEVYVEVYNNRG